MKEWTLKMWFGMAMTMIAMFGPQISYWFQTGFVPEIAIGMIIGLVVIWIMSRMLQRSWTLALYSGLIGFIFITSAPAMEPNGLVMMAVMTGMFFIAFGFVWSMMGEANKNRKK